MRYLTPIPKQFVDQSGIPYSDGTVSVYLSGSDELADIFEDAEGDALYPNPCKLDSNGAWQCFVPGDVPLDYIVKDRHGNVVFSYYNILPASDSGAVFTVKGTEGEIKVTNRVTASGRREATVGLDPEFKQRVTDAENDISDLNERVDGFEGSVGELARDIGEVDGKVEDVADDVEGLHSSLNNKKDRQAPYSINDIPPDRTVKSITQDANGRMQVETQDIEFPDYSQRFDDIENEQVVDEKVIAAALNDLNARIESVEASQDEKNIGERIADAFDSQKLSEGGIRVKVRQAAKLFDGHADETITSISQDENGVITVTYSAISLSNYEKIANKKTSVMGNEGSNTYYPTIKALVDYLDSRLQNFGGKKITNNGVPFTAASQLPTTTPYYGQNINSDDYAYVQDTGLASRYTATVTGSSVAWSLDYEIAIPVFTSEQQAAIDSGVNSTKVGSYDAHLANTSNPHGVTCSQIGASPDTHTHRVVINGEEKTIDRTDGTPVDLGSYITRQDLGDYLTKTGDGSDVTASFTAASSRTNISSGEKLSTLFGKIAKWFSDLKAVAFSGSYFDLSDKPTIPAPANNGVLTIKQNGTSKGTFSANQSSDTEINVTDTTYESKSASSGGTAVSLVTTGEKYIWNNKQSALPTTGTPSNTFAINISGNAASTDIANVANTLPYGRAAWNGPAQKGDKKVVCINPTELNYNDVMVTLDIYETVAAVGDMFRGKLMIDLRRNSDSTYAYNASYVGKPFRYTTMYVKHDPNTHNVYVVFNKNNDNYVGIKAVVASAQGYQGVSAMSNVTLYNNPDVETTTQYTNISITYNYICMVQSQVGSTRLPIFANADGSLSTMNVDEYYCWAQPTSQWTDVMEIDLYNVQNQCNNEILGSVRNINLTSSHPSLCYLRVNLPELQGAGRYRFTLEFEITNSSGILVDDAYGVLILVPPTGYSGEAFLAECVYDSSGKPQSSVMNQFHIPQQGQTTRHKLYVDGHTYRVVKTK